MTKNLLLIFLVALSGPNLAIADPIFFHPVKSENGRKFKVRRFPHSKSEIAVSLPFLLKEVTPGQDQFVRQNEVVILGPHNPEIKSLFTLPLRPCIAVAIFNPHNGRTLLAHLSNSYDLNLLGTYFNQLEIEPNQLGDIQTTIYTHQDPREDKKLDQLVHALTIEAHLSNQLNIPSANINSVMFLNHFWNFEYGQYDSAPLSLGINRNGELFHTAAVEYFDSLIEQTPSYEDENFIADGNRYADDLQIVGSLITDTDREEYFRFRKRMQRAREISSQYLKSIEGSLLPSTTAASLPIITTTGSTTIATTSSNVQTNQPLPQNQPIQGTANIMVLGQNATATSNLDLQTSQELTQLLDFLRSKGIAISQ